MTASLYGVLTRASTAIAGAATCHPARASVGVPPLVNVITYGASGVVVLTSLVKASRYRDRSDALTAMVGVVELLSETCLRLPYSAPCWTVDSDSRKLLADMRPLVPVPALLRYGDEISVNTL